MAYDLEEQESLEQLKAWWEKWGNAVLTAVTVVCLAIAGWNGWNWYQRHQGEKATEVYVQLQDAFVNGNTKNVKSIAAGMMKEYPGHVLSSLAAFMTASNAFENKDYAAAREALLWVINTGKHAEHETIARVRLAAVELDAGNKDKALEVLKAANVLAGQEALYNDRLGDVYKAMGRIEEARSAWNAALKAQNLGEGIAPVVSFKLQALPSK